MTPEEEVRAEVARQKPLIAAREAKWLEDAQANLDAPWKLLEPLFGQTCPVRGSWSVLLEQGPAYAFDVGPKHVFFGPVVMPLISLWALPTGRFEKKSIVNNGTMAFRFIIERKALGVPPEG